MSKVQKKADGGWKMMAGEVGTFISFKGEISWKFNDSFHHLADLFFCNLWIMLTVSSIISSRIANTSTVQIVICLWTAVQLERDGEYKKWWYIFQPRSIWTLYAGIYGTLISSSEEFVAFEIFQVPKLP